MSQTMLCAAVLAGMLVHGHGKTVTPPVDCCLVAREQCVQGFEAVNIYAQPCGEEELAGRTCYRLSCCSSYVCRKTAEQSKETTFTEHNGLEISHPPTVRDRGVEASLTYLEKVCRAKHHDRIISYKTKQHTHFVSYNPRDGTSEWATVDYYPRIYTEVVCGVFLG